MDISLKFKSISTKWFLNILPIFVLLIVLCIIVASLGILNYYEGLISDSAMQYVRDINLLSLTDKEGYPDAARKYVEEFKFRDKVEVQFFSNDGEMLITTNGFAVENPYPEFVDYKEAVAKNETVTWLGKNDNGERVLAITNILPDLGYGSNGAYRVVVSMEKAQNGFVAIVSLITVVGILIIVFIAISGAYFIRSIVHPVREVTAAARKIAGGDMKEKLTVKQNNEIGELCDTINHMASELERAETLKNDFISSVSHELRTPLTAIKGWGETVKLSVGEDNDVVRHGLDVMLGEADRLSGLVEELLDFSRIESGSLTIETSLNDPAVIVSEVVDMYEEIARQNKISLVLERPEQNDMIMADRNRLKQVFINILDNAVKYNSQGGHIAVSMFNEEGCIRITVSDTGCGIPMKDLNHIKEKFYKANNNVRGSGIGLAVADEIVKHHNGLLFAESVEGEGTTITVVLPTVKAEDEVTEIIFPPSEKG